MTVNAQFEISIDGAPRTYRDDKAGAIEAAEHLKRKLLRGQRNIGDFSGWKEHDSYQKSFDRLTRDLRVENAEQ